MAENSNRMHRDGLCFHEWVVRTLENDAAAGTYRLLPPELALENDIEGYENYLRTFGSPESFRSFQRQCTGLNMEHDFVPENPYILSFSAYTTQIGRDLQSNLRIQAYERYLSLFSVRHARDFFQSRELFAEGDRRELYGYPRQPESGPIPTLRDARTVIRGLLTVSGSYQWPATNPIRPLLRPYLPIIQRHIAQGTEPRLERFVQDCEESMRLMAAATSIVNEPPLDIALVESSGETVLDAELTVDMEGGWAIVTDAARVVSVEPYSPAMPLLNLENRTVASRRATSEDADDGLAPREECRESFRDSNFIQQVMASPYGPAFIAAYVEWLDQSSDSDSDSHVRFREDWFAPGNILYESPQAPANYVDYDQTDDEDGHDMLIDESDDRSREEDNGYDGSDEQF